MSLEVRELGTEHDAALRGLLSVDALRNLRLLDAWEETSMGPSRHYGLFSAQSLLAAALVEPSSGRIWPSACAPHHARSWNKLGRDCGAALIPWGPAGGRGFGGYLASVKAPAHRASPLHRLARQLGALHQPCAPARE